MPACCVTVNRVGELQDELDNKEKEHREERLRSNERIKILEKRYVQF